MLFFSDRQRFDPWRRRAYWAAALLLGAVVVSGYVVASSPNAALITPPQGLTGVTHTVGVASPEDVVVVGWEPLQGATGFSVHWSKNFSDVPDDVAELDGSATRAESPELTEGEWYFHIRARDVKGNWTEAAHLGPFVIDRSASVDDEPQPAPSPTREAPKRKKRDQPKATPTPTPGPAAAAPAPSPTGAPAPRPSPKPSAKPSPKPTPKPTPKPSPKPSPRPSPRPSPSPSPSPEPQPTPTQS